MKQLFVLRNTQGKSLRAEGNTVSFTDKTDAKLMRDSLNDDLGRVEWHVSRGKDNLKSAKPHHRSVKEVSRYQRY